MVNKMISSALVIRVIGQIKMPIETRQMRLIHIYVNSYDSVLYRIKYTQHCHSLCSFDPFIFFKPISHLCLVQFIKIEKLFSLMCLFRDILFNIFSSYFFSRKWLVTLTLFGAGGAESSPPLVHFYISRKNHYI